VSVLRATIVAVLLIYVFLWVLAFNGATSLVGPLVVPLALGVLVALGVALQRYMGITPRKQHFNKPEDDPKP
jgi:hypothetical protein